MQQQPAPEPARSTAEIYAGYACLSRGEIGKLLAVLKRLGQHLEDLALTERGFRLHRKLYMMELGMCSFSPILLGCDTSIGAVSPRGEYEALIPIEPAIEHDTSLGLEPREVQHMDAAYQLIDSNWPTHQKPRWLRIFSKLDLMLNGSIIPF